MAQCEKLSCGKEATHLVYGNAPDAPDKKKCGRHTAQAQQIGQTHTVKEL